MAKHFLHSTSITIGVISVADIRDAVRQNPSTEDGWVAHLSVDVLLLVTAAGFNIAQRRRDVVDAQIRQTRRPIQVQMPLLWYTVPDSACTVESAKPLLVWTQTPTSPLDGT